MTVATIGAAQRKGGRERDERRNVEPEQAAQFDAAMRKRKRARGRSADEPAATPTPQPAPPLAWWLALGGANPQAGLDGAGSTGASDAAPVAPGGPEAGRFAPGADARLNGNGLHVRFTQGAWAGMELQASLHAGQVVVTLRPLNRQQHKRLVQAKSSLNDEVTRQTGEVIRLEIADAAR